jgi:hypothetical protein
VGSFSFSKFDQFVGKAALQGLLVHGYNKSDKTAYDKTMLGLGTIGVWMPWARRQVAGAGGWGIKRLLIAAANPFTLTVTYAYVAGAIASDAIDPDEGLDNYLGFTTGGTYGNQPNYFSGDANDSGYFNVVQNLSTILQARDKTAATTEAAYIEAYWARQEALKTHRETSGEFSYYF